MTTLELIERIRSGQDVQLPQEELYKIVRQRSLARLGQKIPPRLQGRLEAEDVLHNAFLKAMAALGGFHPKHENSFTAWVYRIAKNHILDAAGRKSVGAVAFIGSEGELGSSLSAVARKGTRFTSVYRRQEWIDAILAKLEPREAEVIRLRDLESRSYEEIAQLFRSTPGAVQRFHSRALKKVREMKAGMGGE